jgi:hypothetical protein
MPPGTVKDITLLQEAIQHSSYVNYQQKPGLKDNERQKPEGVFGSAGGEEFQSNCRSKELCKGLGYRNSLSV